MPIESVKMTNSIITASSRFKFGQKGPRSQMSWKWEFGGWGKREQTDKQKSFMFNKYFKEDREFSSALIFLYWSKDYLFIIKKDLKFIFYIIDLARNKCQDSKNQLEYI